MAQHNNVFETNKRSEIQLTFYSSAFNIFIYEE